MNTLHGILLICFIMIGVTACNNHGLKERVQIAEGVSVLMPEQYKESKLSEGDVLIRSRIGSTDLRVFSIKEKSMENMTSEELLKSMEINVTRFLEPMRGKLIHRKDTIIDKIVTSNFEFETSSSGVTKHGVGRFLLKGNRFICFLFVAKEPEPKSNKKLQEIFFNSIQVD